MFRKFRFGLALKFIIPTAVMLVVSLGVTGAMTYLQMSNTMNSQMRSLVTDTLNSTVKQISANNESYTLTKRQLDQDLLIKANAVSAVISENPDGLSNEKLTALLKVLEVDEIYVTDEKGVIKYSTVPDFIGYDFNSSEQSKPFMKALTDKTFTLVQEPTPRGADNVLFQYAGVARQDMPGIIQVGVSPKSLENLMDSISLNKLVLNFTAGKKGYAFIADESGKVLNNRNSSTVGKNIKDLGINVDLSKDSGELFYNDQGQSSFLEYKKINDGILFITVPCAEFTDSLKALLGNMTIAELIILVLGMLGLILYIRKTVLSRIKDIVDLINRTTNFNLVNYTEGDYLLKSNDEIGIMAKAAADMRKALRTIAGTIRDEAGRVFTNSQHLVEATAQSAASSEEVARAVEELAKGASDQAREAQDGSGKLMLLSNGIDSIAQKSKSIGDSTLQVDSLSKAGRKAVNELKEKLEDNESISLEVGRQIDLLANESGSIGHIIETIQSISSQTNLLALNAAIEAARAGEAGKGFAVVADEIRKLAEQSSVSTKQINSIVSKIQLEISGAKNRMDEAGQILSSVNEGITNTERAFDEMSEAISRTTEDVADLNENIQLINGSKNDVVAAMQEISAISEEAAASTQEVSASIEEQASTTDNVNATSESLKETAEKLSKTIQVFKM